ncbi:MAG: sigma-70 family RNA polymerase sigma factor [Lachnospiraceae bacterium]|nr:sigma-70 family RNA polymerase sigma factor [Lachnospiraceae bacterium]
MNDFEERLAKAHTGDEKAREELILENRPLVYAVVKRFEYRGHDKEELCQIGMIGLMKAIDRFDTAFGVAFSTYAVPLITGELKRFFRDNSMMKVSRGLKEQGYHIAKARERIEQEKGRDATIEEIAGETGLRIDEIITATEANREVTSLSQSIYEKDGNEISLEEQISAKGGAVPAGSIQTEGGDYEKEFLINKILVEQLLEELEEKQRKLLLLRYFQDKTQTQAAKELGVSQVQVSRMEKKILLELRKKVMRDERKI